MLKNASHKLTFYLVQSNLYRELNVLQYIMIKYGLKWLLHDQCSVARPCVEACSLNSLM